MKAIYIFISLAILTLSSCEKIFFEPEPANNPEALFEDLWNTFNTDYASFNVRGVDWQEVYDTYRPLVSAETSDEELAEVFRQVLRTLDDGHVSLIVPGQEIFRSNKIYDEEIGLELFDLELIQSNYMNNEYKGGGENWNTYGWIGDIGYLHISGFRENVLEMKDILDYFDAAKGLVFDLRANNGGDFTYAITEFGRLTKAERFIFRSRTKTGPGEADYTEWYDWSLSPSGPYFDKPIVLLTDRLTISAGERAVMVLKSLPNLIHVGDTTNGAFATKLGKELANGWDYSLVSQQLEYRDGKDYEGTGMPPDIVMKNTLEEINQGQDRILEEALKIIQEN
ncbi:MAG: S41 family peptidase [Bacteroidales bacterium]